MIRLHSKINASTSLEVTMVSISAILATMALTLGVWLAKLRK